MTQKELISNLSKTNKNAIIVGSLGSISNDLSEVKHKHKILVKGAMGCVIGIGLGLALNSKKQIIVIIGDGSFLMKMGSMSTVLAHKPKNLRIVIINNGVYQSTGGQKNNYNVFKDNNPLIYWPFNIIEI